MPAPEECKEIEHHHSMTNHPNEDSSSFTKEVVWGPCGSTVICHSSSIDYVKR